MSGIVLTAHGLGSPPDHVDCIDHDMWLDTCRLEALLDVLPPSVLLTFDDGFSSCWDLALPILRRRRLTAKFFVAVGYIGRPGYLAADQLRAMQEVDMVIGTHGLRHRPWCRLDPSALNEEIFEAKDRLEQILGTTVTEAACPFGAYDRQSLAALRKAGIQRVYTSDRIPADPGAWIVPRYTLRASDTQADWERVINHKEPVLPWLRKFKVTVKRWR